MKTKVMTSTLLCTLSLAIVFTACKKNAGDATPKPDNQSKNIADVKMVLQTNLNFLGTVAKGLSGTADAKPNSDGTLPSGRTGNCPAVGFSFDTTGGFGVAMLIDYGTGCPADIALGITRKGKLTYKYFWVNNGVTGIGAHYQNYQDGITTYNGKLGATYQYTAAGNQFALGAENLQINNPILGNALYQSALRYEQQQGTVTPWVAADDVYFITGNSSVVSNITGLHKFQVLTPLVNKLNCPYIVAGRVKVTIGTLESVVDFGNGACDNQGTLEIGGVVIPIQL
jgi:hypothetical protein